MNPQVICKYDEGKTAYSKKMVRPDFYGIVLVQDLVG